MKSGIDKKLLTYGFIAYYIFVCWFILCRFNIPEFCGKYRGIELVPFADMDNFTSDFAKNYSILGNILAFIPIGIYMSLFFQEKTSKPVMKWLLMLGVIIGSSLFLEVVQYVCAIGFSSITDVIHNSLGGVIGIGLYFTLKSFIKDEIVNHINRVVIIVFFAVDLFAVVNTIVHIDLYVDLYP